MADDDKEVSEWQAWRKGVDEALSRLKGSGASGGGPKEAEKGEPQPEPEAVQPPKGEAKPPAEPKQDEPPPKKAKSPLQVLLGI